MVFSVRQDAGADYQSHDAVHVVDEYNILYVHCSRWVSVDTEIVRLPDEEVRDPGTAGKDATG